MTVVSGPAHIVAVFARERDRSRAAPHGRVLRRLPEGSVRVSPGLTGLGATLGFALAAVMTPAFAFLIGRLAGEPVPRPLLLGAVAGAVGAVLGALVVRRGARSFEKEINAHIDRARLVALLEADAADAETYCRRLEAQGALEALALPKGVHVEAPGEVIPFARLAGERQEDEGFGATFVAGHADLPGAAARIEDAGVRIAFIGRDGLVGPARSENAGWWRELTLRHGKPIHLTLADGELVLVGDARRIALVLSGHRNDAISSALARLAERFGCPDESARVVTDRIDQGGMGLVLFGPRDARRRAVELLSRVAVASSEGTSARSEGRAAG